MNILTTKDIAEAIGSHNYGPDVLNTFRLAEAAVLQKLAAVSVEPSMYAHELILNGRGVWLGVKEKGICEQAHTPGETNDEVVEYYTAEAIAAARVQENRLIANYLLVHCHDGMTRNDMAGAIRALIGAKHD